MKKKNMNKVPVCDDKKQRCKSLVIEGAKYRTFYNEKFENRKKWITQDPNNVISYIPGTIVKVLVKEGQRIEKGDSILILEAMKMKNRIVIHKSGIVKAVNVKEGDKVSKDMVMIELA